jgi:ketosteroid isomerase-like protein
MKADKTTEAEVKAALSEFAAAYEKHRLDRLMSLFAPDSDVTMIGAGAGERRVGAAQIKAQFEQDWAQHKAEAVRFGQTTISQAGSAAFVAADTTMHFKAGAAEEKLEARLTAGLEKRGDRWLFSQMHLSLPTGLQAEGKAQHAER